jgi:NTE family protein
MNTSTALVLGSGGATGIAWELGVLAGLAERGMRLDADTVIGTSAGAVVAARLTTGADLERVIAGLGGELVGFRRTALRVVPALVANQLHPSRRHSLLWLGRRAARRWTPKAEAVWIEQLVPDLVGVPWPTSLIVVATDLTTGRPAFFTASQPAELSAAVAASCAIPGLFPPVRIDGRLHFDGGLRSPVNLDLAVCAESVIALAPTAAALRPQRRGSEQARLVRTRGASVRLVQPDAASRRAMGLDPLAGHRTAAIVAAGRDQGQILAEDLGGSWPG